MIWILIGIGWLFLLGLILHDAVRDEGQDKRGPQREHREAPATISAPEDDQAEQQRHQSAERDHWAHERIHNRRVTIFSATAAVAAIIAAAVAWFAYVETRRQADAAWEQTKISLDTERRSLRAYVGAGSIKIVQVPPQLTIDIENYGQTPATKVRVFNSWHTIPKGEKLPEDFSFPSKDQCPDALKSETTLYPHVPYGAVAETPACKEALLMIAQSVAGVSELYLYGHIDYRDIFDEPHKTTFCLEWTSGTSAYCGRHNEIDAKN